MAFAAADGFRGESGRALTGYMARAVDPLSEGVIVELGPGPGALTQALLDTGIAPGRLLLIEANPRFVNILRQRFPHVKVIEGDAWNMLSHLAACCPGQGCAAVLSGLPLLNFAPERRAALVRDVMAALAPARGALTAG